LNVRKNVMPRSRNPLLAAEQRWRELATGGLDLTNGLVLALV